MNASLLFSSSWTDRCSGAPVRSSLVQECAKGQLLDGWRYSKGDGSCLRHAYKCGFASPEERYYVWRSREKCRKSEFVSRKIEFENTFFSKILFWDYGVGGQKQWVFS